MPIENASFIKELDPDAPLGTESISEGDNHIRVIKSAVKKTFPELDGAVTWTPEDFERVLAFVDGLKGSGIVASCKYNGTNIMYSSGVLDVTESTPGQYKVIFDAGFQNFDQHYAPIVTPFRSLNNTPVIVSLVGFTSSELFFSMTELDGSPSQGTGFSMLIVDMIQNTGG
jgi:hypothetical protein